MPSPTCLGLRLPKNMDPTLLGPQSLQGLSTGHPCSVYPLGRALGAGQGVRRRGSF